MDEHSHLPDGGDVKARPLIVFFVIFLVFSAFSFVLVKWSYDALVKFENSRQKDKLTMVEPGPKSAIPESLKLRAGEPEVTTLPSTGSLLQPDPVRDMNEMRTAQLARLNSYGWVDREKGIVHVPIEKAMAMTLERSLVRAQAPEQAPAATTQPAAAPAAAAATH
jgi:hypothetical protein